MPVAGKSERDLVEPHAVVTDRMRHVKVAADSRAGVESPTPIRGAQCAAGCVLRSDVLYAIAARSPCAFCDVLVDRGDFARDATSA